MGFYRAIGKRRASSDTRRTGSGNGFARSIPRHPWRKRQCGDTCSGARKSWGWRHERLSCRRAMTGAVKAQVDWYEATVDFDEGRQTAHFFTMRSMAGGGAFHTAYFHATQQAFLEAHEQAFHYFGGVFRLLRYDNLKSAVKKILRGYQREETDRLIAFRSHWGFQTRVLQPGSREREGRCGRRGRLLSAEPSGAGAEGERPGRVERVLAGVLPAG